MSDDRRVLVPLDGSHEAEAALSYAEAFARAHGIGVRLLMVLDALDVGEPRVTGDLRAAVMRVREQWAEDYLTRTAEQFWRHGLKVCTRVVSGDPAQEILVAADGPDVAATVMATHGRGGVGRLMVGSVADKVMRLNSRPTLLVRSIKASKPAASVTFQRLMVPLDGSPMAEAALPLARELAESAGATLVLVRVVPLVLLYEPAEYVPDSTDLDAAAVDTAEAYLAEVRRTLPSTVRVEQVVLRGQPAGALQQYAEEEGVDLVVMTTHGRSGLTRLALGSTADRLVRAGAPVLLVRAARVTAVAEPTLSWHCAGCHRLILAVPDDEARCPRCERHLHRCANCVFWDTTGCTLQRSEASDQQWPGRACPRFLFRETPPAPREPHMTELQPV